MDQEFVFHTMSEAMMYSPREILRFRFIADKSAKESMCAVVFAIIYLRV